MTAPNPPTAASDLPDSVAAALCTAILPVELAQAQRDSLRDRIASRIGKGSPPPVDTFTIRADDGHWRRISGLVEIRIVRRETSTGRQTVMFRLQPGAVVVAHGHTQEEECLVLEGEIEIAGHLLRKGDLHIAKPGARHTPITTRTGAVLWVTSEIPPAHFSPT